MNLPTFNVTLVFFDQQKNEFNVKEINLNDHLNGQGLVLYFYPKDNTQGCTIQATDFSHDIARFHEKGYQVIGVSRDGVQSHKNFITKHNLSIALISDKDEKLCRHFDVIKKKLYGKTYLGLVRSTFIFNKEGALVYELRDVKAKEHSDYLLSLLS